MIISILGIGMMGASIAQACRHNGTTKRIVAYDINPCHREQALSLGIVDAAYDTVAAAVADVDMVIIASPISTYDSLAEQLRGHLQPHCILTDIGSVKTNIAERLQQSGHTPALIIPGHPIAGSEKSGPTHGITNLFENRSVLLTPTPHTDGDALNTLSQFWHSLGADVSCMDVHHHDRVLAITSHLPHLISYSFVGTVADLETHMQQTDDDIHENEVIKFSAGGLRDFTRLAGSDPTMWRDVFLENDRAVLEMLGRFTEDLIALQKAIRWKDAKALEDLFIRTREIRTKVIEQNQEGTFVPAQSQSTGDI